MGNCHGASQQEQDQFEGVVRFSPEEDLATALSEAQRLLAAQDFSAAAPYVQAAAKMGHAEAQTLLGLMFDQGIGFDKPYPDLAVYWWQKAAAQSARYNKPSRQQKLAALTYEAQPSAGSTASMSSSATAASDPASTMGSAAVEMIHLESLMLAAAAGDSTSVAILALSRAQIPIQYQSAIAASSARGRSSAALAQPAMTRSLSP